MPRKKLSEFRAKSLLYGSLDQDYSGLQIDSQDNNWPGLVDALDDNQRYVVKVDQAEKGRFKKGLVSLDRDKQALPGDIEALKAKGYRFLLIEPYRHHEPGEERYLSIERTRPGNKISYSKLGGIEIESHVGSMQSGLYSGQSLPDIDLSESGLSALVKVFDDNYFSFLEINPLLINGDSLDLLDAAVEVDNEAEFFEDGWSENDLRTPLSRSPTAEELAVQELANNSQASFSLEVINPDGSIFLLLSGGGASVVVADEVFNLGYGQQLANYGEYSGNPNFEETRIYTEQIVKLLLKSSAASKVLIIGGGVANFTDIRVTFKGVVAGLQAHEEQLKTQDVKVFVRRGGPYEREGLAAITAYLEGLGIAGHIAGPELLLSDIVGLALNGRQA